MNLLGFGGSVQELTCADGVVMVRDLTSTYRLVLREQQTSSLFASMSLRGGRGEACQVLIVAPIKHQGGVAFRPRLLRVKHIQVLSTASFQPSTASSRETVRLLATGELRRTTLLSQPGEFLAGKAPHKRNSECSRGISGGICSYRK